jgi:hypothetical protein
MNATTKDEPGEAASKPEVALRDGGSRWPARTRFIHTDSLV